MISGKLVTIRRKEVTRLGLTILPPRGEIQVTAPPQITEEQIRAFVLQHEDWIEKHQAPYRGNVDRPSHHYESGEVVRLFGAPLTLQVVNGPHYQAERQGVCLVITVPDHATEETRRQLVEDFYRSALEEALPPLIKKWEGALKVHAKHWRIHAMTSRWGSCSRRTGTVNLNLRLAAMPPEFLEYVVVHELCHFHVPAHNEKFWKLMTLCLPNWPHTRDRLNAYNEDLFGD
jgi:predicted metal-dependent hydrolase